MEALTIARIEPAFPGQIVAEPPPRTPPFQRVDVRLEKRWNVGTRGYVAFVVEALNATLSREVTGYRCSHTYAVAGTTPPTTPTCTERLVGPVSIPSVGLEGGF